MKVACVVEGPTEFYCIPSLLGRAGHIITGAMHIKGGNSDCDWRRLIEVKVLPRARSLALSQPDLLLVVLDRERRDTCPGELAQLGYRILSAGFAAHGIHCRISVVVADRSFECIIFADYENVDALEILQYPVSSGFGAELDGKNVGAIVQRALKPGRKYDKIIHGVALTRRLRFREEAVQKRSKCLRKLLKEISFP